MTDLDGFQSIKLRPSADFWRFELSEFVEEKVNFLGRFTQDKVGFFHEVVAESFLEDGGDFVLLLARQWRIFVDEPKTFKYGKSIFLEKIHRTRQIGQSPQIYR